ncbi:MAG TPA: M14 family zinc carboxypeptidase [Vicinamibacteria bacterium]|nr:M14 family zinc carboxypeptidase [Vicinamibacteria bacterium]
MVPVRVLPLAFAALAPMALPAHAQSPDVEEPGSREAIAAATTEPRFVTPWVAYVPDKPGVPSPTKHLGHIVGAPGELSNTTKIYSYYRALATATRRVRVEVIGRSEEGREILLVMVGDEQALAAAEAARQAMAELADPRRIDERGAEERIASLKPFYLLHGGLHSGETGSPEMLMELAHRLAVSDAPWIREIRDRLVVLINPVAEPDGRDRMVDWFYRHLKGRTDWENLPPLSPPYWGKYVRHDNNRDGIQRKLALTRATQDAYLKWLPLVMHDLHESVPLLSIWTGTGPYNTNLDPSIYSEWHTIAFQEVATLTAMGLPGVWTYGFGEGFAQVYQDSPAINHNGLSRGYETFGNATAETVERVIDGERNRYTGRPVTERDWYRMVPPPKKLKWSLRNNTNYMETAVLAALQYTARNASEMLRNFWRRGASAVRKGGSEKPYAIVIPEKQDDRKRLARLVNLLREHGIEVSRARDAFKVKEGDYPAGTFVVRMDQPYRGFALDLLTPQKYPADKAPYDAYDDVAWALPQSLGVEVKAIEDESVATVALDAVTAPIAYKGQVSGDAAFYLVRDSGQEGLLAARVRLAGFKVEAAERAFAHAGTDYPAGTWILPSQPGLRSALESVAAELAIDVESAAAAPDVQRHLLDPPRLAVLQTWNDTQSAGWVRMIFDEQRIPYTLIMDEDVRRGGLRERFDVILYPNTGQSLKGIVTGIDLRHAPLAFTNTAQFTTHGTPTATRDMTGGLTWGGIGNLEDFVRKGGVLVTLGGASTLPLDGGIARDVRRATVKELKNPGSELRVRFRRPDHPIAYGYPETTSVFRAGEPVYQVRRVDEGRIVLQWGTKIPKDDEEEPEKDEGDKSGKEPPLVVSGGIKGGNELSGKPAVLDIEVGKGRVVAFDFDPIHRCQTESDFRLVWNAILNWNDLPPTPAR